MAGTTQVFNVNYHFEVGGKIVGVIQQATVSAAAQDYNSIRTVLSNNSLLSSPGTLVIDKVAADPSGAQTIFT
jgi:hypothetical protein